MALLRLTGIFFLCYKRDEGLFFMNSKKYFDKVSSQWDDMRKSFFSESVREKAFSVAGIQAGKIAADIGAGTGFMTERNGYGEVKISIEDMDVLQ